MRGQKQQQEFVMEEKQQRQQQQRQQQSYDTISYVKDDYSRGRQSKTYFNDNDYLEQDEYDAQLPQDSNNPNYDLNNYNRSFPQPINNQFSLQDDDDDDGPPGLEECDEVSPTGRQQQQQQQNNNSLNGISSSGNAIDQKNGIDTKSSSAAMKEMYKNFPSKNGENNMKKEADNMNGNKNFISKQGQNKLKAVQQISDTLNSNRSRNAQPKGTEDLDIIEGLNMRGIKGGMNNSQNDSDLNEQQGQSYQKVEPIDLSKLKNKGSVKDSKIDDESKNDNVNENEGDENGQNKYEEIYKYIVKINKFINITGEKIDIIPRLQKIQRMLEQQIQNYEDGNRIQIQVNNEEKKNQKSSTYSQSKNPNNKYDAYIEIEKELIQSKAETIKYLKDYIKLIKESNFQSKICQKMGNILVEFHSIIQEDLNNLKYYNNTIPSRQETEYKEKMEALQMQLEQEQDQRKKLEEELNKRIIDFQQLFCDAQEAKKIIKEQLTEIKDQKEKLKVQNLDLERRQQEFKKQLSQQPIQVKEQQKDNFDAESKRSDRTASMSNNYISNIYKHKMQAARQQNQRDDDMHQSQSSTEHKDSRRKKYDFVMNNENRQFSEDEEDNENSYLESYGDNQNQQKDPDYKYEQQIIRNLTPYSKQYEQVQQGSQIQQQQQNEGKLIKLASPPTNLISASPQSSPLNNNTANIQNQLSPNIKMSALKSVAKSAMKKKLSDHIADDDLKQNNQLSLGLFDFNVVMDDNTQQNNSNYLRSSGNHNRFLSSGENRQIFNSTTQSFYTKSIGPVSSFNNSTIYNYNEQQQQQSQNQANTLRSMIQSIQGSQNILKQQMSNYSILNN